MPSLDVLGPRLTQTHIHQLAPSASHAKDPEVKAHCTGSRAYQARQIGSSIDPAHILATRDAHPFLESSQYWKIALSARSDLKIK